MENSKGDLDIKKEIQPLSTSQLWWIAGTAIFVVFCWGMNWFILGDHLIKDNGNDRGTFGDMFGAVNALFSGLAFAGIIFTILLQRNELKLQREESQKSREEAVEQNYTLRLQRFENTFFNMLNLQTEIVKSLKFGQKEGRQVIDIAQQDLFAFLSVENYNEQHRNPAGSLPPESETLYNTPQHYSNARLMLDQYYHTKFYNKYSSVFNHYFRNIYHIFKFIYFSKLDKEQKNFYATLTRAQLSQGELYLLAFNMLIDGYGKPNALFVVKEYDILQNFEWSKVKPEAFKALIDKELENPEYPFGKLPKPSNTNF